VVRRPLSSEALQARLEAELARCEAGGLANAVLSEVIDEDGVTVKMLSGRLHWNGLKQTPYSPPRTYRSRKKLVIVVYLQLPSESAPWVPGEARLLDGSGSVVGHMPVWIDAAQLEPGQTRAIAVEVERRSIDTDKVFSIEVREQGGVRGVLIERVEL
jgi:uncharacterized protein (TIGR02268 family)